MGRTVITSGTVVSMDPDIGEHDDADLLIEDGEIVAIEDDLSDGDAEVIDADGDIVMPGIVDPHLHAYQSLFRAIVGDWTMGDYASNVHGPIDGGYEPRHTYLGNLFSAYEQLNAGITTVFDFCHNIRSPEHADRGIDALEDAGIRAVFAHGPPNGAGFREDYHHNSTKPHPDYIRDLREGRLADDDGLVTLGMAARGPDFTTREIARHDLELAQELEIPVSLHAGVSSYEAYDREGLLALVDDGLLHEQTSITHGNDLHQGVLDELAANDVPIITTPEAEMQVGHGFPATGNFREAGIQMCVGVDVISIMSGEMFTQLRIALQTQRAFDNQAKQERGEPMDRLSISTHEALEWGTINAARSIGLGDRVGSLTPGKRADVTIISTDDVNTIPAQAVKETIVFQTNPSNVDTVIVDGEVVKRDGELVDPPQADLRKEFRAASRQLLDEAGINP